MGNCSGMMGLAILASSLMALLMEVEYSFIRMEAFILGILRRERLMGKALIRPNKETLMQETGFITKDRARDRKRLWMGHHMRVNFTILRSMALEHTHSQMGICIRAIGEETK